MQQLITNTSIVYRNHGGEILKDIVGNVTKKNFIKYQN